MPGRVALLMSPGDSCFRGFGRRKGERRRKSVRGCIVSQDLSVLNLAIVKKGALLPACGACLPAQQGCGGRVFEGHKVPAASAFPCCLYPSVRKSAAVAC